MIKQSEITSNICDSDSINSHQTNVNLDESKAGETKTFMLNILLVKASGKIKNK